MKQDISKILKKQLLLMSYKLDITLSENIESIKDKSVIVEQGAADRYTNYLNSERGLEQHDIDQSNKIANTYPNYCWNNGEGTIVPGENKYGLSGAEAIPVSKTGDKFCAYRGIGNKLLILPVGKPKGITDKITFVKGSEELYIYFFEQKRNKGQLNPQDENNYLNYLQQSYPFNTDVVSSFELNGTTYLAYVRSTRSGDSPAGDYDSSGKVADSWNDYTRYFSFSGYKENEKSKPYENPGWIDPRDGYQQFIDDWGIWIQMIVGVTAGIATGGLGYMGVLIELGVELGLAAIVAQRDFEKGDNIMGMTSIIFGALPALKLGKYFRGVSEETFKSLSKKLAQSNLSAKSSIDDYVKFYNTKLSLEEQKLMSQALKTDKTTYNQMIKEIVETYGKKTKAEFLSSDLRAMLMSDKSLLKNKSFWKNNIGRDIKRGGIVVVASFLAELGLSSKYNDEQKMLLSQLHGTIPENLEIELAFNTFSNNLDENQKNELFSNLKNTLESAVVQSAEIGGDKIKQEIYSMQVQQSVKDSLESFGIQYVEFEDDNTKFDNYNSESEEQLKLNGYVKYTEKLDTDSIDASAPTKLFNYSPYVKIIKRDNQKK
jgi:hypothetical protein